MLFWLAGPRRFKKTPNNSSGVLSSTKTISAGMGNGQLSLAYPKQTSTLTVRKAGGRPPQRCCDYSSGLTPTILSDPMPRLLARRGPNLPLGAPPSVLAPVSNCVYPPEVPSQTTKACWRGEFSPAPAPS